MEQFDQLLTCAICLDRYRNPKLLPCQHSFCMEPCMEGLINYVTRQVKCPECRAEHRIPYQGLSQYPTNVTLQRFLELHIEITGELPDPTSGQTMERCGVCSEKNYCTNCSHCDKKVCAECKESHLEIIKREIARVNNQIRRSIHRVQDALSIVEKNSTYLQQNCASVTDEIDEVYRRLSKALRDRTDYLKGEVEMYLAKEMSNLTTLRENLEQEVSNFSSNADFADKHMAESSNWEDNELMDAKDILLKTMEFIRNFECEPGDYSRRVRFNMSQDPHQLALSVGGFGELTINASSSFGSQPQPPTVSSVPGLMRSKSDHRVAAQFRQAEERYLSSCGSDTNEGRTSPLSSRRYFGDTRTPSAAVTRDRYGSRRGGDDYDLESSGFDLPSDSRKSRFRSRFMRNLDAGDSDNEPSGRSVRFHEQDTPPPDKRKERERVLDTEDVTRGPLSGVTRFLDSPRVLKRLQEMENKDKRKETKPVVPPPVPKPQPVQPPPLSTTTAARRANRQVSEEDEIAQIKKQNKTDEAGPGAAAAAAKTATTAPTEKTRKTSGQATTPEERSHPLSPTSAERPKFPSFSEKTSVSRTTSSSSERKEEPPYEDPNRRRPGYLRSQSDRQGEVPPSPKTSTVSLPALETLVEQSASAANSKKTYTRSSSSSSLNQDDSDHGSKSSKVGKLPPERLKTRSPSTESSTSNASSTRSSPARTGAAFSTEELKSRYVAPTPVSSVPSTVEAPRNRYTRSSLGETSPPSSSTTPSAVSQGPSQATPRFQSRFLGRAGTPSAEVSKVSESSSGSTSESDSESEEDDDETGVTPKVPVPEVPDRTKDRELARTDIGPLLARSAQARDSCSSKDKEPTPTSSPAYSRTKPSTLGATQATTPTTAYGSRLTAADTPSRYGTDSSSPTAASLARSRTGSSLAREDAEKYPLTSKYLNRSRANMADDSDTPSAAASSASTTSRYGGYKSRFLNRSRSSAALASENEGSGDRNGDYGNNDHHVDDSSLAVPSVPSALSGEERYPSGRSRYAALKERRSRLARSKSSHDVGPDDNPPEDSKDTGNSSLSHLPNPRPRLRSKSREVSPEHNSTHANGDGASLSSWARYLKSKYSTRTREPQDLDDQQPQRPRSRPPSSASNHDARARSPDDVHSDDLPASPTVTTSFPRHQYLQKRNVQLKFGMRGAEPGCFTWPRGVAVGPDNTIVVADSSNHRVQVFDHEGQFLKEFGQYGNGEGEFDCLAGVAVNRIGQYIIADRYNHRIQVFDPSGRFLRMFGTQGTTDGKFSYPWGITTDALGFIYVCDKENHRVQVFQSDGTFVGKFGSLGSKAAQLEHPHYIAVSSINRVIVSDSNNHRIQIFDVNGKLLSCFGSEGAEPGQFKFPRGVAVDDQGYIIVADSGNNRIQIFTPEGAFLRTFGGWGSGDGEFKGLEGIAVMSNGSIVVCDRENHRIQLF